MQFKLTGNSFPAKERIKIPCAPTLLHLTPEPKGAAEDSISPFANFYRAIIDG